MTLITAHTADHITTLTLNRPDTMNPLGVKGDGDAFATACDAINADMNVRCVILTGAGRAFSAGGDIKAMKERTGTFGGTAPEISDGYRNNIHQVLRALYGLRVPLIAAVNGPAIGLGCDLACLADDAAKEPNARFRHLLLRLGARSWNDAAFDARPLWEGVTVNDPVFDHLWGEVFRDIDVRALAARIEAPVLIALGTRDYLIAPPESWEFFLPAFRKVAISMFAQSGHTPPFEEPDAFADRLLAFLSE